MISLLRATPILLLVSAIGCGDTCSDAGEKLCERACECGGDTCKLTGSGSSASVSLSFDNQDDCEALYVNLGCDDSNAKKDEVDFEACNADLDSAKCEDGGLVVPESCG